MSSQAAVRLPLAVLVCCFFLWSLPIARLDAFRPLGEAGKLSDLGHQLLSSPRSLLGRPDEVLNVTVCAIVTFEDPFVQEWLVYHRLLGVQQFYLFDFEGSLATSELMLPWIEAGIVVFHTLTYEDTTIQSTMFQAAMIGHCSNKHFARSTWLFHFDVDEFLILSPMLNFHPSPYQRPGNPAWQYPLHDLMMSPRFKGARCIPVSRVGTWRNVGLVDDLKPGESLLARQVWREHRGRNINAGKIAVQGSAGGLLAGFSGAHDCKPLSPMVDGSTHIDGVWDANDWRAIIDPQGTSDPKGNDPNVDEPMVFAHFEQRTLAECRRKMSHILNPTDWRLVNKYSCSGQFVPSAAQLTAGTFKHEPDMAELEQMPDSFLIEDNSMSQSWYGQQTSLLLRRLPLPLRDRAAAEGQISRLTIRNPDA